MEPKFSVGVPMFFGSFLPRILNKVSAPLTEPFKATYAFDIFRTKIEDALLLTEEAQPFGFSGSAMLKTGIAGAEGFERSLSFDKNFA